MFKRCFICGKLVFYLNTAGGTMGVNTICFNCQGVNARDMSSLQRIFEKYNIREWK